jgi:hypothetical protein
LGFSLCLGCIVALGLAFSGCGGGGGGTPPPAAVPTATIQGSVSGTIIMAIDETGKIVAQDDTAGKTPVNGKYPFTLTVPVGHRYTIQFIVTDNVTGVETVVPLYEGTVNIFSVGSTGTLDLGFVDTSGATAASDNNILTQPGVTSGGTTPPPTIKLQGYRYFYTRNGPTGNVTAKFHVEVRDPGGTTPVTNLSLIKDVAFFDNAWNSLPLSGAFALWNGLDVFFDTTGTIFALPMADIEATLVQAPSGLAAGFYNVVVTDNAGNLHNAKVYFRQPDVVPKPSNLAQAINADNSITLTWTNPDLTGVPGTKYAVYLSVTSDDLNGDGIVDSPLFVRRNTASFTSYTIPASFVASNLAGKGGLKWHVQIRQYDDTVVYPDGTSQGTSTQFYRNYSAESPLALSGGLPLAFTSGMLSGKIFFIDTVFESDLLFFGAGGAFTIDFLDDVGPGTETGSWSINPSGQLDVTLSSVAGGGVIATLLSETTIDLTASIVEKDTGFTETSVLQKTVPVVASKLPGTYTNNFLDTVIFNANGTGNDSFYGNFQWSVDGAGKLTLTWATGGSRSDVYALASSQSTDTSYTLLRTGTRDVSATGVLEFVYSWVFTRQP